MNLMHDVSNSSVERSDIPVLSIIMPLYNSERYVSEAVQSLLSQTFTDFELIIINDASTDQSFDRVSRFSDSRIRLFSNEKNLGIVATRNLGLTLARGKYIAPFDSDDVAIPEKFHRQITFLENNAEYGLLGCRVRLIDEHGKFTGQKWKLNANPMEIPAQLLFRNYFVQSAVVIRREALPAGGYTPGLNIGEDYKMWIDIARHWKTWNYPEYMLKYRVHDQSTVHRDTSAIGHYERKIFQELYKILHIDLDEHQSELLVKIKNDDKIDDLSTLRSIENLLLFILSQNALLKVYDQKILLKIVRNRWGKSCFKARSMPFSAGRIFLKSPLSGLYTGK